LLEEGVVPGAEHQFVDVHDSRSMWRAVAIVLSLPGLLAAGVAIAHSAVVETNPRLYFQRLMAVVVLSVVVAPLSLLGGIFAAVFTTLSSWAEARRFRAVWFTLGAGVVGMLVAWGAVLAGLLEMMRAD
jgi:hypothetical protein